MINFISNENQLEDFIQKVLDKKEPTETDTYISTKEACKLLSISRTTLYRWSKRNSIMKYYINGIPRYSKMELLDKFKTIEQSI